MEKIFIDNNIDLKNNVSKIKMFPSNSVYLNPLEWVKGEIDSFVLLKENWDGYGAIPLIDTIAFNAKTFVSLISGEIIDKISEVYPNPHGTLTMEWENEREEKLLLEIGEHNYSYFINYQNKKHKTVDGKDFIGDIEKIAADISELYSEDVSKFV